MFALFFFVQEWGLADRGDIGPCFVVWSWSSLHFVMEKVSYSSDMDAFGLDHHIRNDACLRNLHIHFSFKVFKAIICDVWQGNWLKIQTSCFKASYFAFNYMFYSAVIPFKCFLNEKKNGNTHTCYYASHKCLLSVLTMQSLRTQQSLVIYKK